MTHSRFYTVLPYLGAVGIVAAATLLRFASDPILQDRQPFASYFVAVIVVARYCGLAPSILALVLSALASGYFFMSPRGSLVILGTDQHASFAFFILFGVFFALLMRSEQRAKQSLQREIDRRKQIEAELQASRDQFRSFVDDGPFAAFVKDAEGKYVYVNKYVERSSGREAEKWMGKADSELFSPAEAKQYVQDDWRVMQEKTTVHFNDTTTWPNGAVQYWSTIKFPLRGEQGRQLLGGIAVDVTEARKSEQQAQAGQARLLLALDAGRMGCFEWNLKTNLIQSHDRFGVLHGWPADRTSMDLEEAIVHIHPEDLHIVQGAIERSLKDEDPGRIVYRVVWPDGSLHWIESVAQVLHDKSARPEWVMGVCCEITERKQVEDALKASEERFRLLAMHAPVGIAQSDAKGRTFFVNPKWCEIAGAAPEESMNYGWQDFLHPQDRERLVAAWQADIAAGKTHSTSEFRFIRKDGSIRWASSTASQIFDSSGHSVGQIGVTEDITDRRQAELALRQAEEQFRVLATQAPVGIFQADESGRITFVNQNWCNITGLTAEEMVNEGWKRAVHPEDIVRVEQACADCVREGREWEDEFRFVNKDGELRWVLAKAAPISGTPDGPITGHVGTIMDVTDRRAAEEKLRERESQLSGILDYTPAVIYLKDSEGRYLLTNRRHQLLFQGDGKTIIGKTDQEFFPGQIAESFLASDARVWQEQSPLDFEEVAPHPEGLHTYRSVKFPIQDAAGKMIALGGISTDITDLKDAHEALREEQELLRNLIEVQEQEKQFLCHEFHDGLIQYAVGSLMLLEAFQINPATSEISTLIHRLIGYLRKGVEDGRRVIRGVRPAVLDDFGLAAAIDDLADQFSTLGMKVVSNCDPEIGRLPDSIQTALYRVAQESLNNAHKYSGAEIVSIELKKSESELHLKIQDSGCGFNVASVRNKGFGLLGMTERVRLVGGECIIQSEPGRGTQIAVRLPIVDDDS